MADAVRVRCGREMGDLQQRRGAPDDSCKPPQDDVRRADTRARRTRGNGRASPLCSRRPHGEGRQSPAHSPRGIWPFFLQDEASQLVSLLGTPEPGARVLDTCASPGGKTTAMAAMADDRATIVATDVRNARVRLLKETVTTSGTKSVRIVQADLEAGLPFNSPFDIVFVDAPCSGLGTVRRDPDIRWRRKESDLGVFARAQLNMIRHAAEMVRPGGRLIYSTCSSEPEENEGVVEEFLKTQLGFRPLDARTEGPANFRLLRPVLGRRRFPAHHTRQAWP